jgi:hypothetical protein
MVTRRSSVYDALLGGRYQRLPAAVQAFHRLSGTVRLKGDVTILGAESAIGRFVATLIRLPKPAPTRPFTFVLTADGECESWTRLFQCSLPMTSIIEADAPCLTEGIGFLTLRYTLECINDALTMTLTKVTAFGCSLPAFLVPKLHAAEHGTAERLHFDVAVHWPRDRRLISYSGYLDLRSAEQSR